MEPLAREKGLEFRVNVPAHPVPVETDSGKVHQIVLNLLSDAVKFTHPGEVPISLAASDGHAVLQVRDTGIGIGGQRPRPRQRLHPAPPTLAAAG